MEGMSKGLLSMFVGLSLFAGIGVIHVLQMIGIIKVDVVMTPTTWEEPAVKRSK